MIEVECIRNERPNQKKLQSPVEFLAGSRDGRYGWRLAVQVR